MIYEKGLSSRNLVVYYTAKTAREYATVSSKLYTHSECDTEWSQKTHDWETAGYFKYVTKEEFMGNDHCIFKITFLEVNLSEEFIKDFDIYMNGYTFGSVYSVEYMKTEDFINKHK
jgi:hypothetical protein